MEKSKVIICPICKKQFEGKFGDKNFPFCSSACRKKDLNRWLAEEYVISEPVIIGTDDYEE